MILAFADIFFADIRALWRWHVTGVGHVFLTYLEPLEDLDLYIGLETCPVVSWVPKEVLRVSIKRADYISLLGVIHDSILAFFPSDIRNIIMSSSSIL